MAEGGKQLSKLDCSICLSAFRDPKLLPCFHTFCLQCLDEYVLRNGKDGKFDCPLCRVCTDIPVGGVKSFQSNFYIHDGYISKHDIDCEVCGEGHESTHYCTDCEQNFCERCTTFHAKMSVSREHVLILMLNDVNEKDKTHFPKVQRKYFCSRHKDEEIKMVCKDCDTKLCVVCKLTEHENHNTSSIAKEAEERRASLLKAIAIAQRQLGKLKSNEHKVNNYAVDIEKELTNNIAFLERRVDSFIAKVKAHSENIKQNLISIDTKAKQYYLDKGKQIRGNILECETVINHAQNVADLGDDSQLLDLNLISKLKSLALSKDCSIQREYFIAIETSNVEFGVDVLGKISKGCTQMSVKELNEIEMESTYVDDIEEVFEQAAAQFRGMLYGSTEANALSLHSSRLYAAFSDYDRFLCHGKHASNSNNTCQLYERIKCGGMTNINNDLYFTSLDDKTVYIFEISKQSKREFISLKDYPHGIAQRANTGSESEHELLVCCLKSGDVLGKDECEGSVIAISLRNKQHYIWRDKEIPGPACIAVDKHTGNVCLGYPAGHKVTLNAADGTVLAVYSGLGCHGSPEIFCPVSVCFDSHCGIIIADNVNAAVIRIDIVCNFLECLVRIKGPLSVLVGGSMLYVGSKKKQITKYQINPITSNKITSFKKKRTAIDNKHTGYEKDRC